MLLIRDPRAVMAAMHTIARKASSKAFSTTDMPSSWRVTNLAKNLRAAVRCFTAAVSSGVQCGQKGGFYTGNLGQQHSRGVSWNGCCLGCTGEEKSTGRAIPPAGAGKKRGGRTTAP